MKEVHCTYPNLGLSPGLISNEQTTLNTLSKWRATVSRIKGFLGTRSKRRACQQGGASQAKYNATYT